MDASYDNFCEAVNALVMIGTIDGAFYPEIVSVGDNSDAHRVLAAAFASKLLGLDGSFFQNYCVELISSATRSGRGGEPVTIPSATAVTDTIFEPIRLAYLNYSLGNSKVSLTCEMVAKSFVSLNAAEGCQENLALYYSTSDAGRGNESSTPIDEQMVMRSPFQNLKHLRCFDAAQRWREQMISATKANKAMQKAVLMPTAVWRRSNRLLMGGAGQLLRTAVSGLDELMGNHDVYQDASYVSDTSALTCQSALRFSGIAIDWSDVDMLHCGQEFKDAQLHHLLPIWPIACGLCIFMDELAKEAKTFRYSDPQVFDEGLEISVNIALMLLRTKDEYRKLTSIALCPSSSSSGSSSSSSSSSFSSSSSSGRAGSPRYAYVSTMMHAFDALKALRGHCWEKLISYVRAAGHGYKTKDWIRCKACFDPFINSVARVSLGFKGEVIKAEELAFRVVPYIPGHSIAVFGDTKAIKDRLKALGGRFHGRLRLDDFHGMLNLDGFKGHATPAWIFLKEKEEEVESLLRSVSASNKASTAAHGDEGEEEGAFLKGPSVRERLIHATKALVRLSHQGRKLPFEFPAMRCRSVDRDWGGLLSKSGSQGMYQTINIEQIAAVHYMDEIAGRQGQVKLRLFVPPGGPMATVHDRFGDMDQSTPTTPACSTRSSPAPVFMRTIFPAVFEQLDGLSETKQTESGCGAQLPASSGHSPSPAVSSRATPVPGFLQQLVPVKGRVFGMSANRSSRKQKESPEIEANKRKRRFSSPSRSSSTEVITIDLVEEYKKFKPSLPSSSSCPSPTPSRPPTKLKTINLTLQAEMNELEALRDSLLGESDSVEYIGSGPTQSQASGQPSPNPIPPGAAGHSSVDNIDESQGPRQASPESKPHRELVPLQAAMEEEGAWVVCWSESKLWVDIIMLLFWEQIFDPAVPYGVLRQFQSRPLDFIAGGSHCSWFDGSWGWGGRAVGDLLPPPSSKAFYARREGAITARLVELNDMSPAVIGAVLKSAYERHKGSPCWGVEWNYVDIDEASSLASAIGGRRLAVVAEAFLRTPETLYRGMPDLLFWRVSPHGAPGGAQSGAAATAVGKGPSSDAGGNPWDADTVFAVEVKSEKESLSAWQVLWQELLLKAGIPIEVLRVQYE